MKYLAALIAFSTLLALATSSLGHPPREVSAEFDVAEHVLRIVVTHDVKDASKHYVNEIEVELNGKKMIEQKFMSQVDTSIQEVTYRMIDAKVGDKIKIKAGCSIAGNKKVEISVEMKKEAPGKGKQSKEKEDE